MSKTSPICWYCKNWDSENGCSYFKHNIPDLIREYFFNHKTPVKNEKVLFELKKEYENDSFIKRDILGYSDKQKALKFKKVVKKNNLMI